MRYFEKQAVNPLGLFLRAGAHLAGEGGAAWLSKTVASPTFKTVSKWFGSQGTIDSMAASKNQAIRNLMSGKLKSPEGTTLNFKNILRESAGKERFTNANLPESVRNSFKETINPSMTLSKAWNDPAGKVKGLAKWFGHTTLGIGDDVAGNLRKSLYDSYVISAKNPDMIYKGSRMGNLARNVFNKGMDAYFVGDAFMGDLEPGETRTGKVLGNMGLLGGYRSSTKMLPGIARGMVYSTVGSKLGNKIGTQAKEQKPLKIEYDPISNQYRYI